MRAQSWTTLLALALMAAFFGLSGCDDAATNTGSTEDVMEEVEAPSCESGCNDGDACTRDECGEDGVTCTHTFDPELCCTDDQCEIDGACFDNESANPENPCEVCSVVTDAVAWTPDDAASCDDGSACTSGDQCRDGVCVGEARDCSDGNACTDDGCDPDTGECEYTNNTAPCDDGDLCTTGDVCADGACMSGEAASCDDGDPCTDDSCDSEAGGCVHSPNTASCDDGDSCSTESICQDGLCVGNAFVDCDDDNVCTADFCAEDGSCGSRELEGLCTDANPCTDEACDPEQGCVYPFNTDPCDDENACTIVDTCTEGACVGSPVDPDDSNPCTDDSCDPAIGVLNVNNTLDCDDGNICTVGDVCADGGCVPGTDALTCDDNSVCTDDSCDPDVEGGCVFTDNSSRCDDGNVCTTDTCDAIEGCRNTPVQSFACRPSIVVTYPPRASTIEDALPSAITVTGFVTSGGGDITSFTINGDTVAVDPTTGAFSYDHDSQVGANTLEFLATDALGTEVERVQAYHWSTAYTLTAFGTEDGVVDPGLGIWLDQVTIDDKQAAPPTDLAAIFGGVLDGFDLSGLLPNPVAEDLDGGAAGTYDVALDNIAYDPTLVELDAIDGGLHITATIPNLTADLTATKTCSYSILRPLSCVGPGTITGTITIEYIILDADVLISVDGNNELVTSVENVNVQVAEPVVAIDGFLAFIIEPIIQDQIAGFVPTLEAQFADQLSNVLGPLLADGLGALAFNLDFDLPRLNDPTATIPVSLQSDFSYTDFQDATPGPQGGALGLRAWATTSVDPFTDPLAVPVNANLDTAEGDWGTTPNNPFLANAGVPMRVGCETPPQEMIVPRAAPIEIVFPDDTLNQILRAAWWGGLLQFPVDPSLLGDVDLSTYGVTNLTLDVSGWLPPIASDCGTNGDLRLYVGDLRIDASLELFSQPLDAIIYTSFEAPMSLSPVTDATTGETQLAITIQDIENVQLEVNVTTEALLGAEGTLTGLLEAELVPALGGLLGSGTPIASFPLPEVDLSAQLGQPAGTSLIKIIPLTTPPADERQEGNTIVYGRLE